MDGTSGTVGVCHGGSTGAAPKESTPGSDPAAEGGEGTGAAAGAWEQRHSAPQRRTGQNPRARPANLPEQGTAPSSLQHPGAEPELEKI